MVIGVSFKTGLFGLLSWRLDQCGVKERLSMTVTPKCLAEGC